MKTAIIIILICVLVLAGVTVGTAAFRLQEGTGQLQLNINGELNIQLECGEPYAEPGAEAMFTDKGIASPVTVEISGQVNTDKVGKYLLKYTAQAEGMVRTAYRYVFVVDSQAPVIKLTENPKTYTLPGQPYKEEGFYATDNYDGDLTDRVIRKEADGKVTYTVSDAYGNTTTVVRTIRYMDPAYPQIHLDGGQMAFIIAGENYQEPGYSSTDMDDGDLTDKVIVTGVVDSLNAGVYTLQYSVTNKKGMTTSLERTVCVVPKMEEEKDPEDGADNPDDTPQNPDGEPQNPNGEQSPEIDMPTSGTIIVPNGKTIYLTFDDGPSAHTAKLLDILKKYNVKVTFFVVNSSHMDIITRAAQEGHTIAMHAYTHNYNQIYASDAAFFRDLEAIQNVIYEKTGIKSMLTRFPGGSSNTISSVYNRGIMSRLSKELLARGYQYFDWNVDSNDAGGAKTADEVFENVTKGVSRYTNSVVLQHDTKEFSIDAVERIIAWGLINGYTFKALDKDSPPCHHGINN